MSQPYKLGPLDRAALALALAESAEAARIMAEQRRREQDELWRCQCYKGLTATCPYHTRFQG